MGVVVKDGVRYRAKDASRVDVVSSVQVKVPVADTDAWAAEQAEAARAALQAELHATRAQAEADLAAELDKRRADFERELEDKRAAVSGDGPQSDGGTEETEETATKVVDPDVTKVREPDTVKSGRGRKAPTE
jgi:hypothetical protein